MKGKHFFLETDIKGPSLKLDNTGKAILTVSVVSFASQCMVPKPALHCKIVVGLYHEIDLKSKDLQLRILDANQATEVNSC